MISSLLDVAAVRPCMATATAPKTPRQARRSRSHAHAQVASGTCASRRAESRYRARVVPEALHPKPYRTHTRTIRMSRGGDRAESRTLTNHLQPFAPRATPDQGRTAPFRDMSLHRRAMVLTAPFASFSSSYSTMPMSAGLQRKFRRAAPTDQMGGGPGGPLRAPATAATASQSARATCHRDSTFNRAKICSA
jgi:hypothetical protein